MPPTLSDAVLGAPDAWSRGDMDAFMAAYHEDAVLVFIGGFEDLLGGEFRGREAIRRCFDDFAGAFERSVLVTEETRWIGDRMLLIQRMRNRALTGGVETTLHWGSLISYKDGLIYRQENYYEVDEALAAAGISARSSASIGSDSSKTSPQV